MGKPGWLPVTHPSDMLTAKPQNVTDFNKNGDMLTAKPQNGHDCPQKKKVEVTGFFILQVSLLIVDCNSMFTDMGTHSMDMDMDMDMGTHSMDFHGYGYTLSSLRLLYCVPWMSCLAVLDMKSMILHQKTTTMKE